MESIIETKAITILQFFQGLHGDVYVILDEGAWAAWLYDLLKPQVTQVVVCNPRRNALLLKQGSKSDLDARKLAELPFLVSFDESFDVGIDTGWGVDDNDYQVPFPFTGKLDKLMIRLIPPEGTDAEEQLFRRGTQEAINASQ